MKKSNKSEIIGVVGLGYVGLPLAITFAKKYDVIGYDSNEKKIGKYLEGIDVTNEVGDDEIKKTTMMFTTSPDKLSICDYIIVAVPTPITKSNLPDLIPLCKSSEVVGKYLKKGAIIIYESTVYPGLTEEICLPILEKYSNKKCGIDFKIAYSPERINPGDKQHKFESITKIVSGMDDYTLKKVSCLYSSVLQNGVFEAESIRVAEAAKVIENTQRDINIAFMNQLSIMFHHMGIDTASVLKAASSKWNFLNFCPGLVGGHCIGVDPFYLIYKSEESDYSPSLLKISRVINEGMPKFIAQSIIQELKKNKKDISKSKIFIYGITFKENVSDIRNSKVFDIIKELDHYGMDIYVYDYIADSNEVKKIYNIDINCSCQEKADVKLFAVSHEQYKDMTVADLKDNLNHSGLIFDLKGIFNKKELEEEGLVYWRL